MLFNTNRARAWTTTAMWGAACLVQVEVHHIKAHVAGARNAQHSIGVSAIIIELPTNLVYQRCNLHDLAIEETQRVGVGHHDRGNLVCTRIKHCLEMIYFDTTGLRVGLDLDRYIVGKG